MAPKKQTAAIKEPTLASILAGQTGRWLSDDEKEEMSHDRTPFYVTDVASTKDKKYGQRWELTIEVDGEERGLTIPAHDARDESMSALQAFVKKNGRVGPMRFKVKPFGDDRTWISLHAVKEK